MAKNLLDVAIAPREVKTHKYETLKVYGLSIEGIAIIVKNRPELFEMFKNRASEKIDFSTIVGLGADICADFLAAGLGYPGDEKAIAMCRKMNAEDQSTIGVAIFEESFPGGAVNFFERVVGAAKSINLVQASAKLEKVMDQDQNENKKEVKVAIAS